jgi:hypothetical protein
MDKFQQKKFVSVNFSHALFSLLSEHDDLAMQALVWLHMFWFVASYANLKLPLILKHQI